MVFDPVAYINEPRWQESRLGLDRIKDLLERLGRPQDRLKFVHVAGTNGKGSTCAYLAAILQKADYKTGLFTSPAVEVFEERIQIDGKNIASEDLTVATLEVKKHAEALMRDRGEHPTEFELMTAVALVCFVRQACDLVVLEVGLGGRLDSTNVIDAPEVAVISRIDLDHTSILGATLAEVATEKAGIIKQGVPVVLSCQAPEALEVLDGRVASCATHYTMPTYHELSDCGLVEGRDCDKGKLFRSFLYCNRLYTTSLLGTYQPMNAALAIETALVLRKSGWNISNEALREGVRQASWPGRFEVITRKSQQPSIVIDGGHNPQGAQVLVDSLKDAFPNKKAVFIVGILKDKDCRAMLEAVVPYASAFVVVEPPIVRALAAEELAHLVQEVCQVAHCEERVAVYVANGFSDALKQATALAGTDGLVCAFGSLYNVASLKAALREEQTS